MPTVNGIEVTVIDGKTGKEMTDMDVKPSPSAATDVFTFTYHMEILGQLPLHVELETSLAEFPLKFGIAIMAEAEKQREVEDPHPAAQVEGKIFISVRYQDAVGVVCDENFQGAFAQVSQQLKAAHDEAFTIPKMIASMLDLSA